MSALDRLAVTTPWYPGPNNPFAGAFVKAQVDAVRPHVSKVDVVHTEDWHLPADAEAASAAQSAYRRMIGGDSPAVDVVPPTYTDGVRLIRVPALIRRERVYAAWSAAYESAARTALRGRVLDADVVHAHVGTYGGSVACALAEPSARVVLTEHATFLWRIFQQRAGRQVYGKVLARADQVIVVSHTLGKVITQTFPDSAAKIVRVGNVVHVDRFPPRAAKVESLRRWLYVGGFIERKGVLGALEAFGAVVASGRPDLEFTLVGHGHLEEQLRARVHALGLSDQVRFVASVDPALIPQVFAEHDLLVHNSEYETFGVTIAEAMAAGTPVLVTRCGGPEEIFEGVGEMAGELVPVSPDATELVAGFHRLQARLDELDPWKTRASIEERYGSAAIGSALLAAYEGRLA